MSDFFHPVLVSFSVADFFDENLDPAVNSSQSTTGQIFLNLDLSHYSRVQKSIENFVFRPKMAIFLRAGMREGVLPLPLAFQYLIFQR